MKVFEVPVVETRLTVRANEDGRLDFVGVDDQTAAFLSALVADDVFAFIEGAKRGDKTPMAPEGIREEVARRVAAIIFDLVDAGWIRFIPRRNQWVADFPKIRQTLRR